MALQTTQSVEPSLKIPVTLEQIAQAMRGLSKRELETLEILMDKEAVRTLRESVGQARAGKFKKLS